MNSNILLPYQYKKFGWLLLVPASILGIVLIITGYNTPGLQCKVFAIVSDQLFQQRRYFSIVTTNIVPTITALCFIAGGMLVAFSKEKSEDEFIASLRLSSLLWAVLVNYALLLLGFAFIYGMVFWYIMVYNMFTVLIIFIIRFHYLLYKYSKTAPDEK